MPPKAAAAKSSDDTPAEEDKELMEKELQLSFLKTRLSTHQERGKILQVENARLGQDLETQKLNLFDINEHLTGELKAASAKMDKLEAQNLALQAEADELKQNHQTEMAEVHEAHIALLEERDTTIHDMEKKVKISQVFLEQKDSLDATLENLQLILEQERKQHERAISAMERQHVQDKDAWKKNTIAQLKETRDRMQKLSENQLETLTKRTILENEAMAAELKYQSRQVELMVGKNQALLAEKAELKRKAELADQTEQELIKRSQVFQKTIKNLLSKMVEESDSKKKTEFELQQLQATVGSLSNQVEDLQEGLAIAEASSSGFEQALEAAREEQSQMSASHDETSQFLQTCMDDIRKEQQTPTSSGSLSQMSYQDRQQAMLLLLTRWQAFREHRRDTSPKRGAWLNSYRGDGIKAAKSLQHRPVAGHEAGHTAEGLGPVSTEASGSQVPGISVMDSVLSLDGTEGKALNRGAAEAMQRMPFAKDVYLKKGLGTLSWLQKSHVGVQ